MVMFATNHLTLGRPYLHEWARAWNVSSSRHFAVLNVVSWHPSSPSHAHSADLDFLAYDVRFLIAAAVFPRRFLVQELKMLAASSQDGVPFVKN